MINRARLPADKNVITLKSVSVQYSFLKGIKNAKFHCIPASFHLFRTLNTKC